MERWRGLEDVRERRRMITEHWTMSHCNGVAPFTLFFLFLWGGGGDRSVYRSMVVAVHVIAFFLSIMVVSQ